MKFSTPYEQRESIYHKGKRMEKYWFRVIVTVISLSTLYFILHLIVFLTK